MLCLDQKCQKPLAIVNAVRRSEYDAIEILVCPSGHRFVHVDQIAPIRDAVKQSAARRRQLLRLKVKAEPTE